MKVVQVLNSCDSCQSCLYSIVKNGHSGAQVRADSSNSDFFVIGLRDSFELRRNGANRFHVSRHHGRSCPRESDNITIRSRQGFKSGRIAEWAKGNETKLSGKLAPSADATVFPELHFKIVDYSKLSNRLISALIRLWKKL